MSLPQQGKATLPLVDIERYCRLLLRQTAPHRLDHFVELTGNYVLDPFQIQICQRLERLRYETGQRILIHAPPQVGKPCWVGCQVLMEDGTYKALGDVQVGDRVITHRSRPQTVTAVHEQGLQPCRWIATRHTSTIAAMDHPFLTLSGWRQVVDLEAGEALVRMVWPERTTVPDVITHIEDAGWLPCRCLTVEHDHTFTVDDLVVHNSVIISQRFPAWLLGNNPEARIRLACYNVTHSKRFSRINLDLMRSQEYLECFPHQGARVPKICAQEEWSTHAKQLIPDGQPSFKALGIRTGFTGLGVDTFIMDDPYKDAQEAYSEIIREGIWTWLTQVVMARINPQTNFVIMFHRWHQDDVAGRLLEQGGWEYLRYPAIADDNPEWPDPLGRQPGEILTPRVPLSMLEVIRNIQGIVFDALFQGVPKPGGGGLWRREYFQMVDEAEVPSGMRCIRFWDTASKVNEGNSFTAGILCGAPERKGGELNGQMWIMDLFHDRITYPDQKEAIFTCAAMDPPGTVIAIEDTSNGQALLQDLHQDPRAGRLNIVAVGVAKDKGTRAAPAASRGRARLVYMVRAPWTGKAIKELEGFPLSTNNDIVDALSGAHAQLFGPNPTLSTVQITPENAPDAEAVERAIRENAAFDALPKDLQKQVGQLLKRGPGW